VRLSFIARMFAFFVKAPRCPVRPFGHSFSQPCLGHVQFFFFTLAREVLPGLELSISPGVSARPGFRPLFFPSTPSFLSFVPFTVFFSPGVPTYFFFWGLAILLSQVFFFLWTHGSLVRSYPVLTQFWAFHGPPFFFYLPRLPPTANALF